jgi:hypothetical protein
MARVSLFGAGEVGRCRARRLDEGLPQSRGGTCHDAPDVAAGGLFVVAGAAAACNVEPVFVDVPDARVAAVVPVAAVGLGTVTTMAKAPRRPGCSGTNGDG